MLVLCCILLAFFLLLQPGTSSIRLDVGDSPCSKEFRPTNTWDVSRLTILQRHVNKTSYWPRLTTLYFAPEHPPNTSPYPYRPPLLYCWIPKNACSDFRLLFLRLIFSDSEWERWRQKHRGLKHNAAHLTEPITRRLHQAAQTTLAQLLPASSHPSTAGGSADASSLGPAGSNLLPGLLLVRNPYVRLLSGYLHTGD